MQYKNETSKRRWYMIPLIIIGLAVLYNACKKSDQSGGSLSITPDSGPAGNVVTITGAGFNTTDITQDSVTFNGLPGQVLSVTASQMRALVPVGVTTGPVMVFVSGQGIKGPVYTVSSVSC